MKGQSAMWWLPNIGTISSLISEIFLVELSWVESRGRDEWELDNYYCWYFYQLVKTMYQVLLSQWYLKIHRLKIKNIKYINSCAVHCAAISSSIELYSQRINLILRWVGISQIKSEGLSPGSKSLISSPIISTQLTKLGLKACSYQLQVQIWFHCVMFQFHNLISRACTGLSLTCSAHS